MHSPRVQAGLLGQGFQLPLARTLPPSAWHRAACPAAVMRTREPGQDQQGKHSQSCDWFLKKLEDYPMTQEYPKELKTGIQTNTCTQMFVAALFIRAKG